VLSSTSGRSRPRVRSWERMLPIDCFAECPLGALIRTLDQKKNKGHPAPHTSQSQRARRGYGLGHSLLGCARLNSSEQGVIGEVGVALRGLVAGVAEHLADSEQIDAAVDHERCC
jgi:hypothetical protein